MIYKLLTGVIGIYLAYITMSILSERLYQSSNVAIIAITHLLIQIFPSLNFNILLYLYGLVPFSVLQLAHSYQN